MSLSRALGISSYTWWRKCVLLLGCIFFLFVIAAIFDGSFKHKVVTMFIPYEDEATYEVTSPYSAETSISTEELEDEDVETVGGEMNSMKSFVGTRFKHRLERLQTFCEKPSYAEMKILNRRRSRLKGVAYKRLQWCLIPKIGTTFIKQLERNVFRKGNLEQLKKSGADKRPKKVFFVREPYSRMVSGYIGKLVTNQPWWASHGRYIIRNFRLMASEESKKCGNDVTFPEFIKYFIHAQETGKYKNTHFIPIHEQCHLCDREYDFVGHLETYQDDLTFILNSVNVSANLVFSDDELTIKSKAETIVYQRPRIKVCESMCTALKKVWWSFRARGLIASDIDLPVKDQKCDTVTAKEFSTLALDAHRASKGRINKSKQKRDTLVQLYRQVPLQDRLKVQELLAKDFELFEYDPQPADLFPELQKKTKN